MPWIPLTDKPHPASEQKNDVVIEKSDEPNDETLRQMREDALNKLTTVIVAEYGRRCDRFEAGCLCCSAWAIFDLIEKMTDGTLLDK